MLHSRAVRRLNLLRIVPAEAQLFELFVGKTLDHFQQARVCAEEMFAEIGARFGRVFLALAVDDFAHAFDEQTLAILGEQRVPIAAPYHLDDVPPRASERGLQFLDDVAVAAHGAVQPLQVAVDDEDQIVEPLARGKRNRPQRLRLVHLTVAQKGPDLGVVRLLQSAVFEIAIKARLIYGHDRAESHRDRRELPKIGHQPRVRIRRQTAARLQLAPEVAQMLLRDAPFQKARAYTPGEAWP